MLAAKPSAFIINRHKRLMSCLASSIGYKGGMVRLLGKKPSIWRLHEEHHGDHGRMWWDLVPTTQTLERYPALKGWTMRIFDA